MLSYNIELRGEMEESIKTKSMFLHRNPWEKKYFSQSASLPFNYIFILRLGFGVKSYSFALPTIYL